MLKTLTIIVNSNREDYAMNANRNSINGLRTKAVRVAAALEELEAANGTFSISSFL